MSTTTSHTPAITYLCPICPARHFSPQDSAEHVAEAHTLLDATEAAIMWREKARAASAREHVANERAAMIVVCAKTGYPSKEQAQSMLRSVSLSRARTINPRVEQRTYRCDRCRYWHLTSEKQVSAPHRRTAAGALAPLVLHTY